MNTSSTFKEGTHQQPGYWLPKCIKPTTHLHHNRLTGCPLTSNLVTIYCTPNLASLPCKKIEQDTHLHQTRLISLSSKPHLYCMYNNIVHWLIKDTKPTHVGHVTFCMTAVHYTASWSCFKFKTYLDSSRSFLSGLSSSIGFNSAFPILYCNFFSRFKYRCWRSCSCFGSVLFFFLGGSALNENHNDK